MHPPTSVRSRVLGLVFMTAAASVLGCEASLPTAADGPAEQGFDTPAVMSAKKTPPPSVQRCTPSSPSGRLCLVDVNVKHGNERGKINLKGIRNSDGNSGSGSGATLTVTVLGTTEFDLSAADLGSLRIGDAATTPDTPLEELNKKYQASVVDLNGDGILDLLLHFSIQEMVDRGNLSEATTSLCLTGEGPGYVINGCGDVVVAGDSGNGGGGGGGFTVLEIIPWSTAPSATPENKTVWVTRIKPGEFPDVAYPGWTTADLVTLAGLPEWESAVTPFASQDGTASEDLFLKGCGITPSAYTWAITEQLLMRTDVEIPPDAKSVDLEFLVDNYARVWVNGTEVTSDYSTNQKLGECPNTARPFAVVVPTTLLSPDGSNKVAVATWDGGYANYFDMTITAQVRN